MAKISGNDPGQVIGTAVCEALGVDPNTVTGFDLHIHIGEPVTVTVAMVPDCEPGELREALAEIQKFTIARVEEAAHV